MTSLFDKLNLRTGERRLVMVVALAVFFFLNLLLVWPRFGDLGRLQQRKLDLNRSLKGFQDEIGRTNIYKQKLDELRKMGAEVANEAQALELQRNVQSQAALSAVQVNSYNPITKGSGKTNAFFEEASGTVQIVAEEKSLVDFLWALGSGNSLIRVRSMQIQPDPPRMKLMGSVTVVASYPKRPPQPAAARVASPLTKGTNASTSKAGSPFAKSAPPMTNALAKPAAQPGLWDKVKGFFGSKPGGATNAPVVRPPGRVPTNAASATRTSK